MRLRPKYTSSTMINSIVVGMIVLIVAAAALPNCICSRSDPAKAEEAAQEFQQHLPGTTGFSCAKVDTDNDGYCACTFFRGEDKDLIRADCGCERWCLFNCASGCKLVEGVKVRR